MKIMIVNSKTKQKPKTILGRIKDQSNLKYQNWDIDVIL